MHTGPHFSTLGPRLICEPWKKVERSGHWLCRAPPAGVIFSLKSPYFSMIFALIFGTTRPYIFPTFCWKDGGSPVTVLKFLVQYWLWNMCEACFTIIIMFHMIYLQGFGMGFMGQGGNRGGNQGGRGFRGQGGWRGGQYSFIIFISLYSVLYRGRSKRRPPPSASHCLCGQGS